MISAKDLTHNITEYKAQVQVTHSAASSRGPSPNRGASVPDHKAVPNGVSKQSWLEENGIDVSKQVKLSKLSHMRYQHPDLGEITKFLKDFGMKIVKKTDTQRWYGGYGPDQYVYYAQEGPKEFLGGAFEVQSYQELERALNIPGAKVLSNGIEEIKDAPGGGYMVTLADPEGFPINLIHGQAAVERPQKHPERLIVNDELEKPRERKFQRFDPGPAEVFKLGHYGLSVTNFSSEMAWYTTHFNIIPSDILYIPAPTPENPQARKNVAIFAHLNLGSTLTDHHSIFLTTLAPSKIHPNPTPRVHHSSYEVHDMDTQFLGHQWLRQKEHKPVWGVGRHILGSQLFDYWWDCTGFMVEHYADGDMVNMETPVGFGPAGHEGIAVWGPEVPKAFLE